MPRSRAFTPAITSLSPDGRRNGSLPFCSCACFGRSTRSGGTRRPRIRGSDDNLALAARPVDLIPPSKDSFVSSTTWTTREAASNAAPLAPRVVARGRGAARGVDDGARRFARGAHLLERLLEGDEACRPAAAAHLNWLLFTPFRYPPPPGGSRFRGPNYPGVFYGADEYEPPAPSSATGAGVTCGIPRRSTRCRPTPNGVSGQDRDRCGRPPRVAVPRDRRHWTAPATMRGCQILAGQPARLASAPSATNPSATRGTPRAARCSPPRRSLPRFRSSSRRGCCRSAATA